MQIDKIRQNVLDFVKKNTIKIVIFLFSILTLAVTIYALLCTVYSDVIVQNGNDFWNLPSKCLLEKEIETTFQELIGIEKVNKSLFVFVLDISGSIVQNQLEPSAYQKYSGTIKAVNDTFAEKVLVLKEKDQVDIYDIAKARLYDLLLTLLEKNKSESSSEFAIWTIGDEGIKVFPPNEKVEVQTSSIKNAIKRINQPLNNVDNNTNFVNLFYRLKKVYKEELSKRPSPDYENPTFVITILSDLIHDVRYTERSREIENEWDGLKEKIQEICDSKIMSNMIVFSEKEPDIHRSVFSLFKENLDWYQLNKYLIGEEKNRTFLYTTRPTENNIIFYYENPNFISKSSFILIYTGSEKTEIKIDIPLQANDNIIQKISIFCQKHSATGDSLNDGKRIISGGSEYKVELETNEKLKLTFNGRIPSTLSSPILRISLCNNGRTYLVPIDFVKRLPDWASKLFNILKQIFLWVSILLGVVLLSFFILKIFVKDQKTEETEGKKSGEIPLSGFPDYKSISRDEGSASHPQGDPPGQTKEEKISRSHDPSKNDEQKEKESVDDDSGRSSNLKLIDINTATPNDLKKILSINAKCARKIKEKRPYHTIDDLRKYISRDIFERIKDQIVCENIAKGKISAGEK